MSVIIEKEIQIKFGKSYQLLHTVEGIHRNGLNGNRQVEKFLLWLYQNSTIHLDRKYKIFLELIARNKETDRLTDAGTKGYPKIYASKRNDTTGY